ncbi:MAG: hypothetical protein ACYCZB_03030 [Acidiphilium sp.]
MSDEALKYEMHINRSLFERAMWRLDAAAEAPHAPGSLRAKARRYLLAERASSDVDDDAVRAQLTHQSCDLLGLVADVPARDFGDVAVKLAVILVEGDNGEGSEIEANLHRILASALAELVILGETPLPSAAVLNTMTEAELKPESVSVSQHDREMRGETDKGEAS